MKSAILNKKQLKRARYLANMVFGHGSYHKHPDSDEIKVRNYFDENGVGIYWTEKPVGSDYEVAVECVTAPACGNDEEFAELTSILGLSEDDIIAPTADHQDIEDAVTVAVEHLSQEAEPPAEAEAVVPEVHLDKAEGKDVPAVVEVINPREKLHKCATMRLAKEYGLDPQSQLSTIVEKFGNDAVVRYQDLLKMVPSFGLTEADVRHQFPSEYAALPL